MLRSYIQTRFQVVGFHQDKSASIDVDFQKPRHRHLFIIKVKLPIIEGSNIDVYSIQKYLLNTLQEMFPNFELGETSCITLAKIVLKVLQDKFGIKKDITISISEDGENDFIVVE